MIENSVKSVAIGSFDGIHTAHRELISMADEVVVIERGRGRLTPGYKRSWYCDKPCAFYIFDTIKELTPYQFVQKLKRNYPSLSKIVIGYDFRFGRGAEGTPETIKALFEGEVVVVSEITVGGIPVHSRTIADMLSRGDIAGASMLLGRNYRIDGKHIRGQGLGREFLVPTINIEVEDYLLPAEGVYATLSTLEGISYPSVTFIGKRKTTDGSFAVETHLLDMEKESPCRSPIFIDFISHIRENRKFDSLHALKKEIFSDMKRAKEILEDGGFIK
jgi:riboflavin kinase/FMN adenylyltransferase